MRGSFVQRMATPAVLAVVLALLGASAVLWPPLARAADTVASTTSDDPFTSEAVRVPELDDALEDPVGTVEETVEDPNSLLDPEPESTTEPAADDPPAEGEPAPDEEPERAPERPVTSEGGTQQTEKETAPATDPAAAGEPADEPADEPLPPARRPLVETVGESAAKDGLAATALAPFQMGLLNDGSVPREDDPAYLLAPLPGYWMYSAPTGPRSTSDIFATLGNVVLLPTQIARLLAPFPVAGPANYSDDWGAPRHVPSYHPHVGTDIFAQQGTPVIASFDGVVANLRRDTAIGGNSLRLVLPDGTFLYYAHLAGFARGIEEGVEVRQGDVLGFVGDTGNARGTPPHLHFEIHPGGGEPTPPVPYLDRWLADARVAVQQYADVAVTPLAPVVAPAATATDGGTTAHPQPAPEDARALTRTETTPQELDGTAAATDAASPLAVLILLGVAALLFLMLRSSHRPRPAPVTATVGPEREPAWLGPFVPLPLGEHDDLAALAGGRAPAAVPSGASRKAATSFDPLPLDVVASSPKGDRPAAS